MGEGLRRCEPATETDARNPSVETSLDAARTCACATMMGPYEAGGLLPMQQIQPLPGSVLTRMSE
jgi:hypothetical protein